MLAVGQIDELYNCHKSAEVCNLPSCWFLHLGASGFCVQLLTSFSESHIYMSRLGEHIQDKYISDFPMKTCEYSLEVLLVNSQFSWKNQRSSGNMFSWRNRKIAIFLLRKKLFSRSMPFNKYQKVFKY